MDALPTGTRQKAPALNLDRGKYGTIAAIGAGQDVARWFFLVGGAAGTVARSISAPAAWPILFQVAQKVLVPPATR